ncbi:hypothetical protein L596_021637 [Steinernema carpocapsae]|nr:hypothetical protein L596_021637 [Steinernema carpocapsae]
MKSRKNLATAQDLIQKIEDILRLTHPYAGLFKTAHDKWKEAEQKAKDENAVIPKFQLTLLNNREAREARIVDPAIHPHRTDIPQGVEHVGMIWISAEGTPPEYSGIRLEGREGNIVTIGGHNINAVTFPTFFPLLNPRGILGYRFGIPLKGVTLESSTQDELLQDCADDEERNPEDAEDGDNQFDNMMTQEVRGCAGRPPRKGKRQCVSYRQHTRFLMHPREGSIKDPHWLFSHEQLAEYYLIVVNNQIERYEMDYRKKVQERTNLRSALSADLIAGLEKGLGPKETLGRVYLAPNSWKGSRAYMQKKYAALKTIVDHLGGRISWYV